MSARGGGVSVDVVHGVLERRYRRLLLAYPAAYRAERGEEILATLVELAPPGQRRPPVREAAALLFGGLRARAGVDRLRTRREAVLGGMRLGVVAVLVCYALLACYDAWRWFAVEHAGRALLVVSVVTVTAAAGALVAALVGRHGVGAALLVVSFAPMLMPNRPSGEIVAFGSQALVAVGLLAMLARHRPPVVPRWHLVAVAGLFSPVPVVFGTDRPPFVVWAPLVLGYLAAMVLAAVVDARLTIATGTFLLAPLSLCVLTGIRSAVEFRVGGGLLALIGVLAVVAVGLGAVGTVRAGRQVRL